MDDSQQKITDNVYYLKLEKDDSHSLCGKRLQEYIEQLKIPIDSRLILNSSANDCVAYCDKNFLANLVYFKSIAYVIKEETATHDPWIHAMLVRKHNNNTHYFDSYKEACDWSISQESK